MCGARAQHPQEAEESPNLLGAESSSPEKSLFSSLTQEKELLWVLFTAACCDQPIAWSIISLEEAPEGINSGLSSWKFVLPAGNSIGRGWHFFSLPTHCFVTWGNCAEQVYVIPPLKGWVKMSSPVINIDIKTIYFPLIVHIIHISHKGKGENYHRVSFYRSQRKRVTPCNKQQLLSFLQFYNITIFFFLFFTGSFFYFFLLSFSSFKSQDWLLPSAHCCAHSFPPTIPPSEEKLMLIN